MSQAARTNMALGQLITNDVQDPRLLAAIDSVPRERFVPPALAGVAYIDDELPLGNGRFLMAPLPFCRLLALAGIGPQDRVLDIGCAYGYSTAVISKLAAEVLACEADSAMAAAAQRNLEGLGAINARISKVADFTKGDPARAPYDVIIIEGGIGVFPEALLRMLAPVGRLVAVERQVKSIGAPGVPGGLGRLVKYTNQNGAILRNTSMDANVPLLPGFAPKPGFVF